MNLTRVAVFVLLCISALAHAQQTADGLQFNVPYLCNDGKVYVVHRCEKGPKFEACFYQHAPDSERYNTREAVVYQMTKMCKVQGPGMAATATAPGSASPRDQFAGLSDSRWDCGLGITLTVFQCGRKAGQLGCFAKTEQNGRLLNLTPALLGVIQNQVSACKALPAYDPAYLAEFPSPYLVSLGMLVGKPQENAIRTIGAFYQVSEILHVLAGSRPLTADEQKFLADYSRAQSNLAQQAAKMFPGQQFDPESNPYRFKRNDPKFGFAGIPVWPILFSPEIQAAFARDVGGSDDDYVLAVAREKGAAMRQVEAQSKTANEQAKAADAEAHYAKDPGSVAARHCLESGRSEMECLGVAMKGGLNDLMGGDMQEAIVGKIPTGLRLTGVYYGNGLALNFRQDFVYVKCGSLNPEPRKYTVDRSGMQISVNIPIASPPLILSYKPDGTLSGQGRSIEVHGEVPAGGGGGTTYQSQTTTTTTQRQLEPGEEREYSADQLHQNGGQFSVDQQTTSTSSTPMFHRAPTVPKTERCTAGTFTAGGESIKTAAILTQFLGSKDSKSANSKPGLRLNGRYEMPGGLKIEFRDDSATLECGESFNSEAYEVLRENGQMVVKFQNNTGPLSLILQPDNTLTGSGAVDVTGRQAIQGANGIDYLPRNAHCSLGTFAASK